MGCDILDTCSMENQTVARSGFSHGKRRRNQLLTGYQHGCLVTWVKTVQEYEYNGIHRVQVFQSLLNESAQCGLPSLVVDYHSYSVIRRTVFSRKICLWVAS